MTKQICSLDKKEDALLEDILKEHHEDFMPVQPDKNSDLLVMLEERRGDRQSQQDSSSGEHDCLSETSWQTNSETKKADRLDLNICLVINKRPFIKSFLVFAKLCEVSPLCLPFSWCVLGSKEHLYFVSCSYWHLLCFVFLPFSS